VHSFLTPKRYFLRNVRVQLSVNGYEKSALLRYLEEALAETVAQFWVRGLNGVSIGIKFPVKNGYVSRAAMGEEVNGVLLGPVNVAGMTLRAYVETGR